MVPRVATVVFIILRAASEISGYSFSLLHTSSLLSRRKAARETKMVLSNRMQSSPELIVFDLDNTVWTPELYTLHAIQRVNKVPVAGKDVNIFPGAQAVLEMRKSGKLGSEVKFAVASRTKSVSWAHNLLHQFGIRDQFEYVEIFPGSKVTHFTNIQASSGIPFRNMMFFDDARDGKYGNCEPVADLGVLAIHCPNGLVDVSIFEIALSRYGEWDGRKGTIVEWDGSVTTRNCEQKNDEKRQRGTVKSVNIEKRYGFIRSRERNAKDIFFHFSSLPTNSRRVVIGDELNYTTQNDAKSGKAAAVDLQFIGTSNTSATTNTEQTVNMRAFSMNMPFAALLANEYKTLETRNGTMFVPFPEGSVLLLHVGQRTYPDGNRHLQVMKSGGLTDERIDELKSLPKGFGRGMVVAICELGRTYESTVAERSQEDTQRKIAAYGEDSGRMVTEIKRVQYLKQPVAVAAQGGVFDVQIDHSVIPDGWSLPGTTKMPSDETNSKTPVYSVSG